MLLCSTVKPLRVSLVEPVAYLKDSYTRVAALENLFVSGVCLSLDEVLRILDPVIQELRSSGLYNDQNCWLFARCLAVMAFVDPPATGIEKPVN